MTPTLVDQIARAVLYEGYILYPYRPSVKNHQRWTFGGIYPRAFSEAHDGTDSCIMEAQCLLTGDPTTALDIEVRFLQLVDRTVEKAIVSDYQQVASLDVAGRSYAAWQEAIERSIQLPRITLGSLIAQPTSHEFSFAESTTFEPVESAGRLVRRRERLDGKVRVAIDRVSAEDFRLTVRVMNETALPEAEIENRDKALMRSLASTHIILNTTNGSFVSSTDPPEELKSTAAKCRNIGCWPVLVGEPGETNTLLASPIILYDYPQVAPESPGDLFDGCEIDEILTLRIMTLTDEEKRQAIGIDPMAADLMARTESLAREQLMNLHGVMKPVPMEANHG